MVYDAWLGSGFQDLRARSIIIDGVGNAETELSRETRDTRELDQEGMSEGIEVTTRDVPLEDWRRELLDKVYERLDPDRLRRRLMDIVDIHSPTGGELPLAEFLADHMENDAGIRATVQRTGETSGNVVGELDGSGEGVRMMLYAPLDTHLDPEFDGPWVGRARPDYLPNATRYGDLVVGLGAGNPKCMVAALIEVACAVREADVPLMGDLVLGFGGGGMPIAHGRNGHPGLGSGVFYMMSHGFEPDVAVIMKPAWAIYAEEPGTCWFRVSVHGTLGYAGMPRDTPGFRSSIVPAAVVIQEIERWLIDYTSANTSGATAPQGWITGVQAGDPQKGSFPSAVTEITLDVRVNPRMTPSQVRMQFAEMVAALRQRHPAIDMSWQMVVSSPGGLTDPDHWIVQSCQRGWQDVEQRPYDFTPYASGQSDGALIRRLGVPCARVGYPWPPESTPEDMAEGLGGMGVASAADVLLGAKVAAYSVVDTLTRSRRDLHDLDSAAFGDDRKSRSV